MTRTLAAIGLVLLASGCKKERVLRLTYDVDVTAAYDGSKNADEVMRKTRDVVSKRLSSRTAAVSTTGNELVVDLAAMAPDELDATRAVIARSGRFELKMLDDAGSAGVLGPPLKKTEADRDGIGVYEESAPDGVGKYTKAYFARVTCMAQETPQPCLRRLKAFTATLTVPKDHEIGFEQMTDPTTAWRTVYMLARAELNESAIDGVRVADKEPAVWVTFKPQGADRFEALTAANVNRRLAIIVDDVVTSAPVIREKIAGGRASITLGGVDPKEQKKEADALSRALASGALPAPLSLSRMDALR